MGSIIILGPITTKKGKETPPLEFRVRTLGLEGDGSSRQTETRTPKRKMKALLSSETMDVPDGVTVKVMDEMIEVKGPRGKLSHNFKHLNLNFQLITDEVTGTKKLKADAGSGSRKTAADIRTALSHVDNLIKGVTKGYRHKTRFVYSQLPINASITNSRAPNQMKTRDVGMFTVHHTIGSVLCCKCGISMQPNAANMCAKCLQSEFDITEGERKHVIIIYCPECDSYLQPPKNWVKAQWESKELLTFCLEKLNNLKKRASLVDFGFIWTEPHSKRIKLKLRIRKKVLSGVTLEQPYVVEYVVQDQMCQSCTRFQENADQWEAVVQLRQHVSHRRTFLYLEQLILKHDAAKDAIRIKQMDQGIDFYFNKRSHAVKFVDFVGKVTPTRRDRDKQLTSHDPKNNTYRNKYTFSVEICPICREDLICLPPKAAKDLGNLGPLVICSKVSDVVALLDPFTLRQSYLNSGQYWRSSFRSFLSSRQLVEYIVLDVEPVSSEVSVGGSRYALADAQVARVSDFGKNDTIFDVRTHLGHLLNPGDYALGYDLYGANSNDVGLDEHKGLVLPDVILIKKSYEERRRKRQGEPRSWKLRSLNMEVDDSAARVRDHQEKMNTEYEDFLKDLEENPDLRFNLSLYRNKDYSPSEVTLAADGEEVPSVPLDELLADLDISDHESDAEDEDSMRD